eukprot:CAMPEP_0176439124 /NCGR_PEP_ID=MMETSP0127-20121128/19744_1 /TAXON_ID=938130 /ORGANISM="Platyophrya macrostoma, Strain WH" /LENGTH=447 /DNA_ID=CAMNT_0017823309 /DNA_START=22 /DNA_END=1365 /DNA_ORIENTATION=+
MESSAAFSNMQKILHFVDPHLALLIIEHYEQSNFFPKQLIHNEKIAVLSKTKSYDLFVEEVEKTPKDGAAKEHIERLTKDAHAAKESISKNLDKYYTISEEFVKPILEDVEKYTNLEKEKFQKTAIQAAYDPNALRKEVLVAALRFARLNFDIGQYQVTQKILNCLVNLLEDDVYLVDALWGKLASDLVLESYADVNETIKNLKTKIEDSKLQGGTMQLLAVRVQLLHTALFAYLHPKSAETEFDQLVEVFTSEKLFAAIPIGGPHLLRYLISALLLLKNNPKGKNTFNLNTIATYLPTLSTSYRESLTDFIKEVLLDFDFTKAAASLKKVKKELESDYFLGKRADQIVSNAQTLFFETYCKVYKRVDLKFVAEFLEVPLEEAEVWIVNLIRVLNMEAKLDLEKGSLTLTTTSKNLYETILQRTRDAIPRTNILINSVNRILKGEGN